MRLQCADSAARVRQVSVAACQKNAVPYGAMLRVLLFGVSATGVEGRWLPADLVNKLWRDNIAACTALAGALVYLTPA